MRTYANERKDEYDNEIGNKNNPSMSNKQGIDERLKQEWSLAKSQKASKESKLRGAKKDRVDRETFDAKQPSNCGSCEGCSTCEDNELKRLDTTLNRLQMLRAEKQLKESVLDSQLNEADAGIAFHQHQSTFNMELGHLSIGSLQGEVIIGAVGHALNPARWIQDAFPIPQLFEDENPKVMNCHEECLADDDDCVCLANKPWMEYIRKVGEHKSKTERYKGEKEKIEKAQTRNKASMDQIDSTIVFVKNNLDSLKEKMKAELASRTLEIN
jgi:hypothetical protein